ncbi:hypothetical protein C4D60_Mb07t14750 [Musa balbisiana]|uniref:E3 ubiquitin-protein ligase Sina-like RING finger domain-containing protein n=1 Tax=Musa balbisiana TaxID=52838 RepID=A0A4S8JFZ5_MUSBA|nr:hypothetical protein C4D60_Mb07t14750 [Musa balbisiana]
MESDNIECISVSDGMVDNDEVAHVPHPFLKPHGDGSVTVIGCAGGLPAPVISPVTGVHQLLEFPVCTNSLCPPIHQCHNGHNLCSGCKSRVHNRCPTCKQWVGDVRCLALEKHQLYCISVCWPSNRSSTLPQAESLKKLPETQRRITYQDTDSKPALTSTILALLIHCLLNDGVFLA